MQTGFEMRELVVHIGFDLGAEIGFAIDFGGDPATQRLEIAANFRGGLRPGVVAKLPFRIAEWLLRPAVVAGLRLRSSAGRRGGDLLKFRIGSQADKRMDRLIAVALGDGFDHIGGGGRRDSADFENVLPIFVKYETREHGRTAGFLFRRRDCRGRHLGLLDDERAVGASLHHQGEIHSLCFGGLEIRLEFIVGLVAHVASPRSPLKTRNAKRTF